MQTSLWYEASVSWCTEQHGAWTGTSTAGILGVTLELSRKAARDRAGLHTSETAKSRHGSQRWREIKILGSVFFSVFLFSLGSVFFSVFFSFRSALLLELAHRVKVFRFLMYLH